MALNRMCSTSVSHWTATFGMQACPVACGHDVVTSDVRINVSVAAGDSIVAGTCRRVRYRKL